jgi:hypothetical protein
MNIKVNILRTHGPTTNGKLADGELHFFGGELDGLKLVGFGVWARRDGTGYNVTFPARPFDIHGERKYFTLLRSMGDSSAENEVRRRILEAYLATEERRNGGGQATADEVLA